MHKSMFVLPGAVMRRLGEASKLFALHLAIRTSLCRNKLVQDSKTCIERLAALQNAGCRAALIGFGDKAGESLYGLDPVYDWHVGQVNGHAKACNMMVVSLDLKPMSGQTTLFDKYHFKDLPANRQALAGFVMDVAALPVRGESQAETQRLPFTGIVACLGRSMRSACMPCRAACPRSGIVKFQLQARIF